MTQAAHWTGYAMPPSFDAPAIQDRVTVGLRLRRARKEAGLTLAQAADKAGLSRSTIGSIERGEHDLNSVSRRNLINLPSAFGLSASEFSRIVRPIYGEVLGAMPGQGADMGREIFNIEQNRSELYVQIRLNIRSSGIHDSMPSYNQILTSVLSEMAQRALGGLVMDKMYVNGIPAGYYALWSDRQADVGELVIVEHHGGQYPAFLLEGGFVVTDVNVDEDTTLRFLPDRIIGAVEEVRILTLPRRSLS